MDSAHARLEVRSDEGGTIQIKSESIVEGSSSGLADLDVQGGDEASRLRALATDVRDQDDLERDIGRQVSKVGSPLQALYSRSSRQLSYSQSKPMKEIKNGLKKQQGTRSKALVSFFRFIIPNVLADGRERTENFNLRLTNYNKN